MAAPDLAPRLQHRRDALARTRRRARAVTGRIRSGFARHLTERAEWIDRVQEIARAEAERVLERGWGSEQQRELRRNRELSLALLLAGGVSSLDRTVSYRGLDRLRAELQALGPSAHLEVLLRQAYRILLDHETRGLGRVAGSTYNILGKLVAPVLLQPPPGPVLEIGTLYGLFAPALLKQLHRSGEFRHLSVLDPFVGAQVQPGTKAASDPSGVPVTAEVARRNLITGGLSEAEFRVVVGYSTDEQARAVVADREYAVVVIDGDHSANGVLADLWWVETICAPAAVVIMDDFGDARWAGVEAAVTRYLAEGGRLRLIATAHTSAYLRMP